MGIATLKCLKVDRLIVIHEPGKKNVLADALEIKIFQFDSFNYLVGDQIY